MTLASAAFGFGQPLHLMFAVGVLALGLWRIRTLHIQIWRPRNNFLHAGFLSPPVSDRANSRRIHRDQTCRLQGAGYQKDTLRGGAICLRDSTFELIYMFSFSFSSFLTVSQSYKI